MTAEVLERMAAMRGAVRIEQGCLFYAVLTATAVSKRGVRAILQAGSASWPFKAPERDDGVGPTHYSYMFEAGSTSTVLRLANGRLPEMHCWAAIPATGELIDLTTRHLPELLPRALPGEEWSAPVPPLLFWGRAESMPAGWRYEADAGAIGIAFECLRRGYPQLFAEMAKRQLVPPRRIGG